jgi:hypothetical protein
MIGHWGRKSRTRFVRSCGGSGGFLAQTIFASPQEWITDRFFAAIVSSIAFVTFDASSSLASNATHSFGINAELIDLLRTVGEPLTAGSTRPSSGDEEDPAVDEGLPPATDEAAAPSMSCRVTVCSTFFEPSILASSDPRYDLLPSCLRWCESESF